MMGVSIRSRRLITCVSSPEYAQGLKWLLANAVNRSSNMPDQSLHLDEVGGGAKDDGSPGASEILRAYWERRLAGGPNLGTVGYEGLSLAFNRWMYRIRGVVFDRAVAGLGIDIAHARVLDIGSGSGFYVERWLKAGASKVVGLDLTEVAVSTLRLKFPECEFLRLDVTGSTGQLVANSFSAVSAMDVLYHVTDDALYRKAIENISNLLRPGGVLLFSENCLRSGTVRAKYQVSRSFAEISDHLSQANMRIIHRAPIFILMNNPIDSSSISLRLIWRVVRRFARREGSGYAIGLGLYPLERFLLHIVREGPSTELVICRKGIEH
jgi:2-polyprenyl-3-methyl-5-hydroxy-6-metoxy-1,4-benzoquinol methylase